MKRLFRIGLAALTVVGISMADTPAVRTVGEPVALTEPGAYYMAPKWSPRGGTLAVTGANYAGIYLVDFPGGEVVQLTADPAAGFGMAWSHEGNEIAARIARFENRRRYNAVAVFDIITGERQPVTDFIPSLPGTPKWTRNDRYLYMTGTNEFRLISPGKTLRRDLSATPDEEVVYVRENRIHARVLASQTELVIKETDGRILSLTISPDGTKIAFEELGGPIWVTSIDGRNPVNFGLGDTPAWSPTSDKIAFAVTTDDGHRILSADIYVVNVDGTGKVNLTDTPDVLELYPSWSPDGRWIAYGTMDEGRILVQEVR